MPIYEELLRLYEQMDERDPAAEFERLGMTDHDGMRRFGQLYGKIIAGRKEHLEMPLWQDLGAAMVGGIYLGLALAAEKEASTDA